MEEPQNTSKTLWHRLLGSLLKEILPPVGISVHSDIPIMSESPRADILLLRREHPHWTNEQLLLLPDGIRETQASHILLEFKYTESITENAFQQALGYDFFYRQAKDLTEKQVQTFLLSAKTPQAKRLSAWGYVNAGQEGVYQNPHWLLKKVPLLLLNELPNQLHNAFVKCFASRKSEKKKAFQLLRQSDSNLVTAMLEWFLKGLWKHWFIDEGDDMTKEMTPEQVVEMGKMWGEHFISRLTVEDVLNRFTPQEIFAHFKPAERIAGLTPAEILAQLEPAEIEAYLKTRHQQKKRSPKKPN